MSDTPADWSHLNRCCSILAQRIERINQRLDVIEAKLVGYDLGEDEMEHDARALGVIIKGIDERLERLTVNFEALADRVQKLEVT